MPLAMHHRDVERSELKSRLLSGASILMLAPRRIGKTWLLGKIADDMRREGWLCVLVDAQGISTEDAFLRAICAEIEKHQELTKRLWSHLQLRIERVVGNAEGRDLKAALSAIEPRQLLETLIEGLDKEKHKTLILIDEIALFVLERVRAAPDEARTLLYHLRKLQLAHKNVVWLLTGSVGLDAVGRRHGLQGALLDYDTFELLPFSKEAAGSFIADLCETKSVPRPFQFAAGAFERLVEQVGWLAPYYLRQIALEMRPSGRGDPLIATPEDVDRAIDQLLTPARRMHFSPWEEHIQKNFDGQEGERLRALLNALSENADGEIEATLLARLEQIGISATSRATKDSLLNLSVDGYIENKGVRWAFRSGLLRRYWLEYVK